MGITWLIGVILGVIALLVLSYLLYAVFFSAPPTDQDQDSQNSRYYRGFERRAPERTDRRKKKLGPPPGVEERRKGLRRHDQ